jgi:hypothetical protein
MLSLIGCVKVLTFVYLLSERLGINEEEATGLGSFLDRGGKGIINLAEFFKITSDPKSISEHAIPQKHVNDGSNFPSYKRMSLLKNE